jgi:hypothetical protein
VLHLHACVVQQLLGHLPPDVLAELAEAHAVLLQVAVERAAMHAEQRRDVVHPAGADDHLLAQEPAHGRREIGELGCLLLAQLGLDLAAEAGIDRRQRPLQPMAVENDRRLVAVEAQRAAEELEARSQVRRRMCRERHGDGQPLAAEQVLQDVECDGHGTQLQLGCVHDPADRDCIDEAAEGTRAHEADRRRRAVQVEVVDEILQAVRGRGAAKRRAPGQSEVHQPRVPPDQQADVVAPREPFAGHQQPLEPRVLDGVLWVVEEVRTDAGDLQCVCGIDAEAA